MIKRIGHMTMRVADLDRAVEHHIEVLGLTETERRGEVAYMTCNDRHHELILVAGDAPAYEQVGLEVEEGTLEAVISRAEAAGAERLGPIFDGEPGIDRAALIRGPGGHLFKLFSGMERGPAPEAGDGATKFEHVSLKVRNMRRMERFLQQGLGFQFSDRMRPLASWWRCDADHHGLALVLAPRPELAHYAWSFPDFAALGRLADRLAARGQKLLWGPSRHGPGNNQFAYYKDADRAVVECCADMAQVGPGSDYAPREWPFGADTLNRWGPGPPLEFILAGTRIAEPPTAGRPGWLSDATG